MSFLIHSTVQQKVDEINSLLTCLLRMHFQGMTIEFLSAVGHLSPIALCEEGDIL